MTAAWFALVVIGSFLPLRDKEMLHTRGLLHLWFHVAAFGIGAALLARFGRSLSQVALLATAAIAFGLLIEVAEHLVFLGPFEWSDVFIDTAAVALGSGTLLAARTARAREAS